MANRGDGSKTVVRFRLFFELVVVLGPPLLGRVVLIIAGGGTIVLVRVTDDADGIFPAFETVVDVVIIFIVTVITMDGG